MSSLPQQDVPHFPQQIPELRKYYFSTIMQATCLSHVEDYYSPVLKKLMVSIDRNQNSTLGSCKLKTTHVPLVDVPMKAGQKLFFLLLLYIDSTIFEEVVIHEKLSH